MASAGQCLLIWAVIGLLSTAYAGSSGSAAGKMLKILRKGSYDINVLPPGDNATVISVGASLIKVLEVEEDVQTLTARIWYQLTWNDSRLKWDDKSSEEPLRVPPYLIWRPDIMLYNSVRKPELEETLALVYPTGKVLWIPPVTATVSCDMDFGAYPFDTQKCFFKFGSWTYHGYLLNVTLSMDTIDISNFGNHSGWQVVAEQATREDKIYPCCKEPYPSVTFPIQLRRRPQYHKCGLELARLAGCPTGPAYIHTNAAPSDGKPSVVDNTIRT